MTQNWLAKLRCRTARRKMARFKSYFTTTCRNNMKKHKTERM